ncbi:MAG: single-stranded-DNA-specific exonuclease RecJ [Phycisphaerales bacterium]|nr:single-stranded-DNA-specific exonuclease RecJ [Phycisphaerales bacterium]
MHETVACEKGLTRRWTCRGLPAPPGSALCDRVLASRGLQDLDRARAYLSPSLTQLRDPAELPDMDRAASRILDAARAGEPIVIYGDYDVDGITASTVMYRMIRAVCPQAAVSTYIPHRLEEGYGLNAEAIRALAHGGARLIVSVDCGVTASAEAETARSLGVDLIITDHHNPPKDADELPPAFALVHPGLPGRESSFRDLCGAGVAYKVAWRLATLASGSERVREDLRGLLLDLLGPVSLGVVADVVPLVDENRVLTRFGLGRVKHSPFVGLRALVRAAGLAGDDIDTERVGFVLAPRLNACGRMGHAREALELLITEDEVRAAEIALQLTRLNEQRRRTEQTIVEQACELAEALGMTGPQRRAIVLAHEDWHPGVVGIVCSRLVERYGRPTILMQKQGDLCVGSGRSIDGFNLHGALVMCAEHLSGFGGHDMAAGVRVHPDRLAAFAEAFIAQANSDLRPDDLVRRVEYDCDGLVRELDVRAIERLQMLAPFGRGNPHVAVRLRGVRVNGAPKRFGSHSRHMSLELVDEGGGVVRGVRAVGWGWAEHAESIPAGCRLDAIVRPTISTWNGRSRVEVELQDVLVR